MSTTTYRVVKVQIHTPVDGQSYKSVSWVWRVETSPLGAFLAGEDGKPLDFDTRAAAEVARFNADPHGWTDENGMRYRCGRCHEPLISILPAELTSGTCRCGGLIEADPRNFEYREGEEVEVLFPDGWKKGPSMSTAPQGRDRDYEERKLAELHPPNFTRYCPGCQREAMEAHMDRNSRWYAVLCLACEARP